MLSYWIALAKRHQASDLHLESNLPAALRVGGALRTLGDPVASEVLNQAVRELIPKAHWNDFLERRSYDVARVIKGVQCRISVLQSSRGLGLAIRLLSGFEPTVAKLNLHPEVGALVRRSHGLILVCGPTGSGKSSTLAALIAELNRGKPLHVITIEDPIEYHHPAGRAFIRQREVGRDTPSFQQALLDALREDPDVIMVGEMRRRETMQLTLDAAETGHLVLATVHSSSCSEALQRLVGAFPAEVQASVRAQLADCLAAVVAQRLVYHPHAKARVPECEVLTSTPAVRANVRDGAFHKLAQSLSTGAADGMWTFDRYRRWLDERRSFYTPSADDSPRPTPPIEPVATLPPVARVAPEPQGLHVIEPTDAFEIDAVIAELEER